MKITIRALSLVLILYTVSPAIPANASPLPTPPKGKTEKKIALQPHPQSNQDSADSLDSPDGWSVNPQRVQVRT